MKQEGKQIGECKNGREQTGLDCSTDKAINDRVCFAEAGTGTT